MRGSEAAQIAQLVEQGIENPRVGGSIPSLGTEDPAENKGFGERRERQGEPEAPRRPYKFSAVREGAEGVADDGAEGVTVDVEASLAVAVAEASRAGRWDVVAQLARELEARRANRVEKVIAFTPRRAK